MPLRGPPNDADGVDRAVGHLVGVVDTGLELSTHDISGHRVEKAKVRTEA